MTRCSTGADAMIGDVAVEGCKAGCESGWLTWKGSDGDLGDDGVVVRVDNWSKMESSLTANS